MQKAGWVQWLVLLGGIVLLAFAGPSVGCSVTPEKPDSGTPDGGVVTDQGKTVDQTSPDQTATPDQGAPSDRSAPPDRGAPPDRSAPDKPAPNSCGLGPNPSTWEAIHATIIKKKCLGCHDGKRTLGGLDLSLGVAHKNLIAVDSKRPLDPKMKLIFPGEQKLSFFYLKMEAKTLGTKLPEGGGKPMPSTDIPALSKDQLEAMRLWIRAGAPKKGVVQGTDKLLKCGLSDNYDPNKSPPLDPPKKGEGVQFVAGPWKVKAGSEDEVCFATYYDFTRDPGVIPEWAKAPCPNKVKDGRPCFAYNYDLLSQDPQSHHSINRIYAGSKGPGDAAWGPWTCRGGPTPGTKCDPTKFGVPAAKGGADCGKLGVCSTPVRSSPVCTGFGPSDLRQQAMSLNGSQAPVSLTDFGKGVYKVIPAKGFVIWNSHGFNLSKKDTTIEQFANLRFAKKEDQKYLQRRIFDQKHIFVMNVPPFEKREYCTTYTIPKNARLTSLGSHVHIRGTLFRIWMPPNDSKCAPNPGSGSTTPKCVPRKDKPAYTSTIYDDPVTVYYNPPKAYDDDDPKSRTFLYCGVFDNGATDQSKVKRRSKSKGFANCGTAQVRCIGGPNHNKLCKGDNAACDSKSGAGDGVCDACPLKGGLTTEDEMFILLGGFYINK